MTPTVAPKVGERPGNARTESSNPTARAPKGRKPVRARRSKRRPGFRLRSSGRRLRLAAAAMACLFLLLAGRLIQLQGFQSHTYAAMAEKQRRHTVPQPATRGEIVDRSGNVLAVNAA